MTRKKQSTIARMKTGQSGVVIEVGPGLGMRRLEVMGLRPGKRVTKISGMFARGPVVVQVDGFRLALGFGMAKKIMVEVEI
ncbi:MAG: FeoA family protein [Dehalococcoidia bacterium]